MTNAESKQQYEGAILQQLIKNSERLAVVEKDISSIKEEITSISKLIKSVRGWLITIFIGILINIISQPVLSILKL